MTLTGNSVHYVPDQDYFGIDTFTYVANDTKADSNSATVTLNISPVNDAPIAEEEIFFINEDQSFDFTLSATDIEADTLTYSISQQPLHGTVNCNGAVCQYIPDNNFNGTDSFDFQVNDGTLDSQEAQITIEVSAMNDVPVAFAQSHTVTEDTPLSFELNAQDDDNYTLTYVIVSDPTEGNITISGNNITYTPSADFHGIDRFEFKVNDGKSDSNIAVIDLNITSVNDIPIADNKAIVTAEDTSVNIGLSGYDSDGDTLTYAVKHAPNLVYTPDANFSGTDTFTYTVSDQESESAEANVTITITEVNDAPVANAGNDITVSVGTTVVLDATQSIDSDGNIVSYEWKEGTVSLGTSAILTKNDFSEGVHTLSLTVIDDKGASATDTVVVTIEPTTSSFIPHSVTTEAVENEWLETVDLDQDGDLDIVSASTNAPGRAIAWYQNRGDHTYTEHIIAVNATNAESVRAADLDDDGDIDLVYTTYNGADSLVYCQNDGNQSFSCNALGNSIGGLSFVAIADIDNDQKLDLITASWTDNRIDWQKNNGDGTFAAPVLIDNTNMTNAIHISVADLNNDGNMDIVAAANGDNRIDWYANDGSGNFTPHFIDDTIQSVYAAQLAKINADDSLDLISVSQGDGKVYWHNNSQTSTPNFLAPIAVATGLTSVYYASGADMDNDGDIDILTSSSIAGGKIAWYENIGNNTNFPEHIVANGVNNVVRVYAADMDLDGNMDVVAGDADGNIVVYENNAVDAIAPLPKTGDSNDGAFGANADFTRDDTAHIVTDAVTGLMWADDSSVSASTAYWSTAEHSCSNMNLGNYTDWRIPTLHELYYLLDRSQSSAKIDTIFNNQATDDGYWVDEHTSWSYGWVDFNSATSVIDSLMSMPAKYIRCVRGDKMVFQMIRNDNLQVVLDKKHNLMWDDSSAAATITENWADAKAYCTNMTTAGYSDWRLPNINELLSIATIYGVNFSFNKAFVQTDASQYWSATVNEQGDIYVLDFGGTIGDSLISDANSNLHVRCVRTMQ